MPRIYWPAGFVPGFADNFASNEIVMKTMTADQAWPWLATPERWPGYFPSLSAIAFWRNDGPLLTEGVCFDFTVKVGGKAYPMHNRILECVPPLPSDPTRPARLAWHSWRGEENTPERFEVHHIWLMQNLEGGRLSILTQETQIGRAAVELANTHPNAMVMMHQAWLEAMAAAIRQATAG
ncbi:SRPBCC domain-containing protein [Formicincola oecophyllae]|uniref:SRPBCC domain-containing protein n=1 Tax=Formicincola oecophyllae TaxID=2558361 RepID=A0A4Y6UAI3_9PROT|nr:SRPBCC domain-containing protein [Formicincola oecophyllae]QDH13588.1 SRPBCC domain-containing protein [Formicincola oecophyllae]